MGILPDHRITAEANRGMIVPFNVASVQPASYDLHLDDLFIKIPQFDDRHITQKIGLAPLDVSKESDYKTTEWKADPEKGFVLKGFALASTIEKVKIPRHLVARVEGKSSLARLGMFCHVTAGFIDPGFEGHITLELFCAHPRGLRIFPGMPVCQIGFETMDAPPANAYGDAPMGSKYQNQPKGPTPSRYFRNFQSWTMPDGEG